MLYIISNLKKKISIKNKHRGENRTCNINCNSIKKRNLGSFYIYLGFTLGLLIYNKYKKITNQKSTQVESVSKILKSEKLLESSSKNDESENFILELSRSTADKLFGRFGRTYKEVNNENLDSNIEAKEVNNENLDSNIEAKEVKIENLDSNIEAKEVKIENLDSNIESLSLFDYISTNINNILIIFIIIILLFIIYKKFKKFFF